MIIPSIDIMNGRAVQLIGGEEKALEAGDPRPIAERFSLVGEIAVIDLDAAMGKGDNAGLIRELVRDFPCRVGGGIRDVYTARQWLDAGARKVIMGTVATPEILSQLPRERTIAALDARHNDVVIEGWTKTTGVTVEQRIDELKDCVGGFLVTFVESEGRLGGLPIERVRELAKLAQPRQLTVAGGVRDPQDIARADRAGADAQVGMALYTHRFDLADGFAAPLTSDRPDGLWPTVVTDESGNTLGLAYSSLESLRGAINTKTGVYFSRSRNALWRKGETSGNTQQLLAIDADCDRDALRFTVRQTGPFCHTQTDTCFGDLNGLAKLERTLRARVNNAPDGSYTRRLLEDDDLLARKLLEEAHEFIDADNAAHTAEEAADALYFLMVTLARRGVTLADVQRVLDRRALKVTRRPGNAKPQPSGIDR